MMLLQEKTAIISGASSGIGRAVAMLFSAAGASIVLNARSRQPLEDVASAVRANGGRAAVVVGDVGEPRTHRALVETAVREFGGLDIAINNAGTVGAMRALADLSVEDWSQTLQTNLTAALLASRAQIPAMLDRGSGAIVFTSSFVGTSVGLPGMAAYAAAKAGLMGLVKGIAADYGARGIRPTRCCRAAPIPAWLATIPARPGQPACVP